MTGPEAVALAAAAVPEGSRPLLVRWLTTQAGALGGPSGRLLTEVAALLVDRARAEAVMFAVLEGDGTAPTGRRSDGDGATSPGDRRPGTVVYDQDLEVVGFFPPRRGGPVECAQRSALSPGACPASEPLAVHSERRERPTRPLPDTGTRSEGPPEL